MAKVSLTQRIGRNRGRWLTIGVVFIIVAVVAGIMLVPGSDSSYAQGSTTTVTRGNIVASVASSGTITAIQDLNLSFETNGTVDTVLVKEGDIVEKGQTLATLDTSELQLQVDIAQSQLESAQAKLDQTKQGNATPEDIASQEASVANAQAQLEQTRTGNITTADIAQAEADVRSAQAQLNALLNPSADNLSSAELAVAQKETNLQMTRDSASLAKTNAEIALQKTTDALVKSQAAYAEAKSNWSYVEDTGNNPSNPTTTNAQGETQDNDVNNAQREQYYAAFVQAEADLRTAERNVHEAQVSYDQARQDEITEIQQAEAELADARKQIEALHNPDQHAIAERQAAVDRAQASLQQRRQGGTQAEIAAAQAQVNQQIANLEKLTAPSTASDISIQEAAVKQAELELEQAQLNLENANLKAPFAGIITEIDIVPGSAIVSGSNTTTMRLMDRSTMYIDMDLSENDIAAVALDQEAMLSIDALRDWEGEGVVTYIAPEATITNDVVIYPVRVSFPDTDESVKVGMTANIEITTATKDAVLLVPNSALLPKGSSQVVQIPTDDPNEPTREVEVQTGLKDATHTEIISGLKENDVIITTPIEEQPADNGGLFGV